MSVRRLLVPMLALVAAIGTVSLVVVLQRRAQRTEAARVSVAQLQVQVSAIQSTEISQAITGTSPLRIASAATARYAAVDRTLASRAQTDPIPEMAAARRALRQTRVAAIRVGQVSQRFQTRPNGTVPPPVLGRAYAANADANDELQRALGDVSHAYARKASATVGQADWGSAVGVAVLLGLFLVFYVRSQQARVFATRQANSDSLTGLGNRRRLYRDLAASQLEGSSSTIVLIDLDGFKQYNDSRGHQAGDELLSTIGASLKDAIGGRGSAYRLGGDEFLLRLAGRVDDGDVAQIVNTVRGRVSLSVGVSYGIAQLGPREPLDHAMRHADKMMYENKIRKRIASGIGVGDGPNDRYAATVDYPTKISPG
jgi:diguanylate cyclase (GGDEF)-like protein